jgi:hypothetical protein
LLKDNQQTQWEYLVKKMGEYLSKVPQRLHLEEPFNRRVFGSCSEVPRVPPFSGNCLFVVVETPSSYRVFSGNFTRSR